MEREDTDSEKISGLIKGLESKSLTGFKKVESLDDIKKDCCLLILPEGFRVRHNVPYEYIKVGKTEKAGSCLIITSGKYKKGEYRHSTGNCVTRQTDFIRIPNASNLGIPITNYLVYQQAVQSGKTFIELQGMAL